MKKILYSVGVLTAVFLVGLFVVQSSPVFGEDVEMGTLVVQKVVINDNGGVKDPSSFSFQVNGDEPVTFENDGRNTLELVPGNYTVTEPAFEGYTSNLEGCTEIEILPNSKNVCIITNDDIAPATGSLKVFKKTNTGDGTFNFKIVSSKTFFDITTVEGEGEYTLNDLLPGKYSIREKVQEGWIEMVNTCEEIEVFAGKTSECKIRNRKVEEGGGGEDPVMGTLIIDKTVINDNGKTFSVVDFPGFTLNGGEPTPFTMYQEDPLKSKMTLSLAPGIYVVSEPDTAGYNKIIPEICGAIEVVAGKDVTCSLVNDDTNSNTGGSGGGNNGDTNNGGSNNGGGTSSPDTTTPTTPAPAGEVLGASTEEASTTSMCTPYVTTFMRLGGKNNKEEVKLLQSFLNENLSLNPALKVDGIFGKTTKTAVIAFQEKYKDEVLIPWKSFGLKDEKGTGIVYKTTLRWINMVKCSGLNIPMPQLP